MHFLIKTKVADQKALQADKPCVGKSVCVKLAFMKVLQKQNNERFASGL